MTSPPGLAPSDAYSPAARDRAAAAADSRRSARGRRAFWVRQLHTWHWISSAVCLVGMLLFAVTGITLNHAAEIEARPVVTAKEDRLPPELRALAARRPAGDKAELPAALRDWIANRMGIDLRGLTAEWQDAEIYVAMPRPGGDAFLTIDPGDGAVLYERTDRGWISYLNDLHKGRNTGAAWGWFIDIFAVACLAFCLTGLVLLQLHAGHRPATWPVVGLGLLAPVLLAILFIH